MLRYHHAPYWWWQPCGQWFYTSLRSSIAFAGTDEQLYSSSIAPGTLYTPIVLFPPENEEVVTYGSDILLPRVENYEGILFGEEKDFRYKGHTWNDVSNFKLVGDIYNLPLSDERDIGDWSDWGNPGLINPITGNTCSAYLPLVYNKTKHFSYSYKKYWSTSWVSTKDLIESHNISVFHYFDKRTNNLYEGAVPAWFTDSEGRLVDAYLDPIGEDGNRAFWPMSIWVYRVYGINAQGRPWVYYSRVSGLYDSSGVLQNRFYLFRNQDERQVISHLEALCRIDGDIEGPLRTGGMRYGVRSYAPEPQYFRMSGSSPDFGKFLNPDYAHLFPQADRRHNYCNWNAIAADAYQSLGMTDMNGIAGLADILGLTSDVKKMASTLQSIPVKGIKSVASAYLGAHYGFKLMVSDLKTLRSVMSRYAEQRSNLKRCQASSQWTVGDGSKARSYTSRYQVFYDEFANVEEILDQLLEIADFGPTTENWWDSVPMSFVVDWFIGISDVLQSLDTYANLRQKHDVICCGRSIKGRRQLTPSELFDSTTWEYLPFDVHAVYYTRQYQEQLILPSLVPSVTINPFNHMIEGAALIISRR